MSPVAGRRVVPDLVHYQLRDGPHAGEPTSERGEVERLARECLASERRADLESTVVETRFNVVRSGVPHRVETVRKLRDYLPPEGQHDAPAGVDAFPDGTSMTIEVRSRKGRTPGLWFPPI
jgi:hypothetical protein